MPWEFDQTVYVRSRTHDGRRSFGSGYLVAPTYVLTSAHVVGDVGDPVTVGQAGQREWSATVAWRRRTGPVDAALVEITDSAWAAPPDLRPVRWGRLTGTRPGVACQAIGYPRTQREENGRWEEQLSGHVNPGTAASAGRYEIHVDDSLPLPTASGDSPWAGMSGASVLSSGTAGARLLIGVITQDRMAYGGRLSATRAEDLLADAEFNELIQTTTGREPLLESVELAGLLDAPQPRTDLRSPAFLLRADAEVVAFRGRRDLLDQLATWCEGGGLSVRLLVGPGGQGKTRLSRRLVSDLYGKGWVGGHVLTRCGAAECATFADTTAPLVLVVDYAETRLDQVRLLLGALAPGSNAPAVRVLLIARTADEWWERLRTSHPDLEVALTGAVVHALAPLEASEEGRHAAFGDAVRDLADRLGRLPDFSGQDWTKAARIAAPPRLLTDTSASVLTIQMTALVELLQRGPHPVDIGRSDSLEDVLLNHERRYWQRTAAVAGLVLALTALERAVAAATLCGAADPSQAEAALRALPGWEEVDADRRGTAARWIHGLYPATDAYWGSLQPDRIGEHLIANVTREVPDLLDVLLPAAEANQRERALEVLARVSTRQHEHLVARFRSLLGIRHWHIIMTMIDATLHAEHPEDLRAALTAFLEEEELQYGELLALTMITPGSTHVLRDFGVQVAEKMVDAARELARPVTGPWLWSVRFSKKGKSLVTDLAVALVHLSERHLTIGRREDARNEAEEAVALYRRLGRNHHAGLADALRALANQYRILHQNAAAVAAAEEAVALQRRLVAAADAPWPRDHQRSQLAHALDTLSAVYGHVGRGEESLAAGQEAAAVEAELAESDPDNHTPRLAATLTTVADRFADMGHHADSVEKAEEAVTLLRDLARKSPDLHLDSLAVTLNNLSNQYGACGRHEEALTAVEEAVAGFRWLADRHAATGQESLATALVNNAVRYALLGRHAEGLAPIDEAIAIRRSREDLGDPVEVAHCLSLKGGLLVESGRPAEAVEPLLEALNTQVEFGVEPDDTAMWIRTAGDLDPEGVSTEWRRLTGTEADWISPP